MLLTQHVACQDCLAYLMAVMTMSEPCHSSG